MTHYNVFQQTCGCNGTPKEWVRLFAIEADSEQDAVVKSMSKVPPGTVVMAKLVGSS